MAGKIAYPRPGGKEKMKGLEFSSGALSLCPEATSLDLPLNGSSSS